MTYETGVSALSPKLWYKTAESSGTSVVDSGSLGINGTYTNGTILAYPPLVDTFGAYKLDGTDDYISIASSTPSSWSAVTFAAWVRLSLADTSWIMSFFFNGGPIPLSIGDNTGGYNSTVDKFAAGSYTGSVWRGAVGTTTVTAGTAYHVAATVTNGGNVRLYVNGSLEATSASTSTWGAYTGNEIRVGRRWDSGNYYKGQISEFALWDSSLSGAQISTLYATGTGQPMVYDGPEGKEGTLRTNTGLITPYGETSTGGGGGGTIPTTGQIWPRGNWN